MIGCCKNLPKIWAPSKILYVLKVLKTNVRFSFWSWCKRYIKSYVTYILNNFWRFFNIVYKALFLLILSDVYLCRQSTIKYFQKSTCNHWISLLFIMCIDLCGREWKEQNILLIDVLIVDKLFMCELVCVVYTSLSSDILFDWEHDIGILELRIQEHVSS